MTTSERTPRDGQEQAEAACQCDPALGEDDRCPAHGPPLHRQHARAREERAGPLRREIGDAILRHAVAARVAFRDLTARVTDIVAQLDRALADAQAEREQIDARLAALSSLIARLEGPERQPEGPGRDEVWEDPGDGERVRLIYRIATGFWRCAVVSNTRLDVPVGSIVDRVVRGWNRVGPREGGSRDE